MTTNIAALAGICSARQSAHRCQPQAAGLDPVRGMVTVKGTRAVLFAQKLTRRCDCHRVTNLASHCSTRRRSVRATPLFLTIGR